MVSTKEYMDWVAAQEKEGISLTRKDDDHIRLETDTVTGEINIHHIEMEVVELRLVRRSDDENVFFLHFELNDMEHAKELYREMESVLEKESTHVTTRVLLTCTSAMTTSFFAGKLSEGAKTLSLDYEFAAVSYPMLYEKAFDYDVILVAPQIAHEYEKVKKVLEDKLVLNIPAAMFATYDTGAVLEYVRDELAGRKKTKTKKAIAKVMRDIDNHAKILVMTVTHDLDKTRIGCRLYDDGEVVEEHETIKRYNYLQDLYDTLDVQLCRCKGAQNTPDMVAVSMPGVMITGVDPADFERIDYADFAKKLSDRYHTPCYVANNANLVALGYYAGQDKYDTITYHSQPRGSLVGGEGIVFRGHVLGGAHNMAGEIGGLFRLVMPEAKEDVHVFKSPEEIGTAIRDYLVANIAMIDPDVILVRSDLTPDMERLRKEIEVYMDGNRVPELIYVRDVSEYAYLGTMMFGLHEYKKSVAQSMMGA